MNSHEIISQATTSPRAIKSSIAEILRAIVVLFKLRVVILLVLASMGGALLASGGTISFSTLSLLLGTGVLSSAGASAINQYLERSSDALMHRTLNRPLAAGLISQPGIVLGVAVSLVSTAIGLALLFGQPSLAVFLGLGAVIYVGIYTIWLKPRSLVNIVIGGAAGSCAVLSGSAAAGNWSEPGALVLSLLIFIWTPIHFWSLAMAFRDDYSRAGVPMLPTVVSDQATAWWIALHTGAAAAVALMLAVHPKLGMIYFVPVLIATIWMISHSIRLVTYPNRQQAFKVFKVSNMYLGLVLLFIYLGTLI